jgi:hypothetical protein
MYILLLNEMSKIIKLFSFENIFSCKFSILLLLIINISRWLIFDVNAFESIWSIFKKLKSILWLNWLLFILLNINSSKIVKFGMISVNCSKATVVVVINVVVVTNNSWVVLFIKNLINFYKFHILLVWFSFSFLIIVVFKAFQFGNDNI